LTGCGVSNGSNYAVTYELKSGDLQQSNIDSINNIIKARFAELGYSVKGITNVDENTIKVDVKGKEGLENIADAVGKQNEFKILGPDDEVIITENEIKDAAVKKDSANKQPLIFVKLTSEGKEKLASATAKYIGKSVKVYWDDEMISSPTVQSAITNGELVLTGGRSSDEATLLTTMIKSGKTLPMPLKVIKIESSR
jgi:preprotein translocase subunit SecD